MWEFPTVLVGYAAERGSQLAFQGCDNRGVAGMRCGDTGWDRQ